MLYQDLIAGENHGIYTALFDSLRDAGVSDLKDTYITAEKLDARFSFENDDKECYFKTLQQACDVLTAKYLAKWTNLIKGVLKNNLPAGATSYSVSDGKNELDNKNSVSAYDSNALVTDSGNNSNGTNHNELTTYDLTGQQFILNLYKNNNVYDIINTDIRKTLFRNVYTLDKEY